MKMKTLINTAVVVAIASLIVGCANTGSQSNNGGGSSTGGTGTSDDKVTLQFASWRVEEIEAFKQLNAKFNEEYPNIEIKYEPIKATEYDSVLNTALSTGTGADLYYVRPFDLGLNLYKSGHLLEVTEENVPNIANVSESQKSVYVDENNTLFAAPYVYVAYGFLYNEALFEEYNVSIPETWDEFYAVLDTFKKAGITPLALGTKDVWVLSNVVFNGNYANFVDGENWRQKLIAGEAKVTDPGLVESIRNLQKWAEYMPDHFEGIGYTEAQQMFLAEQAAIFPSGSWEIAVFQSQNPDLKLGYFTSPTTNPGDKKWVGFNGGAGLGVNPKSAHIDEAFTYINWLMSEEAQIMAGNLMSGLFPSANIDQSQLTDPLAKAWMNSGGANGENFAIGWSLQKVSAGTPNATQLSEDVLPAVFKGEMTPEEAAKKIQEGLDTWFKP